MQKRAKALLIAVAIVVGVMPLDATGGTRLGHAVSARQIRIGLHVPMTGAAPLPSQSAQRGAEVYWRYLRSRGTRIHGRSVEAIVKNDNYNPSQAVAMCKEMVEKDHVFLLAGILQAGGVDQIQACARYAASVNVPYISLGMTRIALSGLPRYFAITKTWPQQARMLADYLVSDLGGRRERNGVLRHDSPNNEETIDAFVDTMRRKDARLHYNRAVSRNAGANEAQTVVAEMKAAGIENVFVLSTPVWFLQVLQAAQNQNFEPTWLGISGIPLAGDGVVNVGCRNGNIGRSRFLSPLPAFEDRDSFDRRHDRAMNRVYDERGDSITWLGWAGSKAIRKLLERAGRDLSRRRFERTTERAQAVRTHILPRFGFTPKDHFGGQGTHVLKADCRTRRWITLRRFVGDFH